MLKEENVLKKVEKMIDILLIITITILFIILIGLVFLTIISRFFNIFSSLIEVAEEASRYVFIWVSFLGGVIVIKRKMHIRIDVLVRLFSGKLKFVLLTIADLLTLVFIIIVIYHGIQLLPFTTQHSSALGIGMYIIYSCVPVSFLLMAFYLILRLIERYNVIMIKKR